MKLIVHEITTGSVHQAIVPTKNQNIGAVRPHLYIKGGPLGDVKVQVTTLDGVVIGESAFEEIASISGGGEFHGYVTFYLNAFLKKNQTYLVKIVTSYFGFSELDFVGIVGGYQLKKYAHTLAVTHPRTAPLDLEIWTNSEK